MALYPDYCTLDDVKRHLRIPGAYSGSINTEEDTYDDITLGLAITAASRVIDNATGRQFGQSEAVVSMYYSPEWDSRRGRYVVSIDDVMTTSGFIINTDTALNGTYTTEVTDYRLFPLNAQTKGRPWTEIVFGSPVPVGEGTVEVVAKVGWDEVPDTINNATLIQAARIFKRRDAPFGVAGSPEMGNELRLLSKVDPDVEVLITPYKRWWVI